MMHANPRGTRDILPAEMEQRRKVEAKLRSIFERFGYREVQTPTFEHLELISAKSGEEIAEHLYAFEDKKGRRLALRPELSAPTIRLYVNSLRTRPKPRKLYYFENCFRYERPQKGRYREFWQAGVELIGSARPEAEAEVVALAERCLKELGLTRYTLSIGHLGLVRSLLEMHGVGEGMQNHILSLLDKGERQGIEELNIPARAKSQLQRIIQLKGSWKGVKGEVEELLAGCAGDLIEGFESFLEKLQLFGVERYRIDLGIARGLDYYTGMVFEIHAEGLGAQDQICGGGTYSLVKLLGGGDTPSCGFAFGFDRLMLALESQGALPGARVIPRVLVVPETWKGLNRAIKITSLLRKEVSCDLEIMGRKLSKSLAYADAESIPYVLIVPDEKGDGVILRDMASGEQKVLSPEEVADAVR